MVDEKGVIHPTQPL